MLVAGLLVGPALVCARSAEAQTTLDKVRAQGYVQCGAVPRPGLAAIDEKGRPSGLLVEMCRAVAIAALGRDARFAFHLYDSDKAFDSVRAGADQVSFVSFAELTGAKLASVLSPGSPVFIETHDILVDDRAPFRKPADIAGQSVCFITGAPGDASLEAFFEERKLPLVRYGLQEIGEMYDTFRVQRCKAVVDEATALAEARTDGGVNNLKARFLDGHLKAFPIVAATQTRDDAQWAAVVAWTAHTLMAADEAETMYRAGGLRAMRISGADLGLSEGWQDDVVATVGNYSAVFRRTLGADSPLKLDQGLNTPVARGGALVVPVTD